MSVFDQIPSWVKDPQSWIGVIALITALGFWVGVFEPGSAASFEQSAQASRAAPPHSGA